MKGGFSVFKGPMKDNKGNVVDPGRQGLPGNRDRAGVAELPGRGRERRDRLRAAPMSERDTVTTVPASPAGAADGDQWYPLRRSAGGAAGAAGRVAGRGGPVLDLPAVPGRRRRWTSSIWSGAARSAVGFPSRTPLQRAAPLLLTALCVALPGQLGLVIIGGEAAVVLGGLAATVAALPLVHTSPVRGVGGHGGGRVPRWARSGSA